MIDVPIPFFHTHLQFGKSGCCFDDYTTDREQSNVPDPRKLAPNGRAVQTYDWQKFNFLALAASDFFVGQPKIAKDGELIPQGWLSRRHDLSAASYMPKQRPKSWAGKPAPAPLPRKRITESQESVFQDLKAQIFQGILQRDTRKPLLLYQ